MQANIVQLLNGILALGRRIVNSGAAWNMNKILLSNNQMLSFDIIVQVKEVLSIDYTCNDEPVLQHAFIVLTS